MAFWDNCCKSLKKQMEFWNSLKESSQAALDVVKNDLTEFTSTVTNDTATFFDEGENNEDPQHNDNVTDENENNNDDGEKQLNSDNASTTGTISNNNDNNNSFLSMNSISSSLGTFSDTLYKTAQNVVETLDDVMAAEEECDEDGMIALPKLSVQERMHAIQFDRNTYARPPNQSFQEKYIKFVKTFDINSGKKRLESQKLLQNSEILSIYHDLVPAEVEEDEFWKRYFFWKQEIEETIKVEEKKKNSNSNIEEAKNVHDVVKTPNLKNINLNNIVDDSTDMNNNSSNTDYKNINNEQSNVTTTTTNDVEVKKKNDISNIEDETIKSEKEIPIQQTKSSSSNESWTVVDDGINNNNNNNNASPDPKTSDEPLLVNTNNDNVLDDGEDWDEWE